MAWTSKQLQAITQKGSNILVAAAAGSGKTAVLVERIVNKITKENVDIDKLLVVTFTNAAATEMREAKREITLAHNCQTEIIQNEASGISYGFSLLFAHAQDTLMTINSEVRMAEEMIDILRLLDEICR